MLADAVKSGTGPELAEKIREIAPRIATAATELRLHREPEWEQRFGERARKFCLEDNLFHLGFIASAVQFESPPALADYVRWLVRMLRSRKIDAHHVHTALADVAALLESELEESQEIAAFFAAAARLDEGAYAAGFPKLWNPLAPQLSSFLRSIRMGDRPAAARILTEALEQGQSVDCIHRHVVHEAMYELGRLWERNEITVADEHLATAVAQAAVTSLYPRLPLPEHFTGRAVVTAVQGEHHQLGANLVADVLESNGWNVRFLGSDIPDACIVRLMQKHQANLLALSVTMLFNVPAAARLIATIRRTFGNNLRILLGGAAFKDLPGAARALGADAVAVDIMSAVSLSHGMAAAPA